MNEPSITAVAPSPPRFSWPMRLFLCFILLNIIGRSLLSMFPYRDWARELDMSRWPAALPAAAKWNAPPTDDDPHPYMTQCGEAAHSFATFWAPVPEGRTWKKLKTWQDGAKWGICWFNTRYETFENLVGFNQEWPMFSPNVSRRKTLARARLWYDDGSTYILRGLCDPPDLTRYSHWFQEKLLQLELRVYNYSGYEDYSFGYCNHLAHTQGKSAEGASLEKITLFEVQYKYPPPDVDARAFLAEQTGPPADQVFPEFYTFDVKTRRGSFIPATR